jgi:hypothetical protein
LREKGGGHVGPGRGILFRPGPGALELRRHAARRADTARLLGRCGQSQNDGNAAEDGESKAHLFAGSGVT